ncbi:uncharacterized protein METZ01_LOCUS303534, partial [marine metagenome]
PGIWPRYFQTRAVDRCSGDDRTSNQNLPVDVLLYLQCTSARPHAVHWRRNPRENRSCV